MAAQAPSLSYRPLGTQSEPTMRAHNIVCLHTMVGYLTSTDRYFRAVNGAGYAGTESHYGIGGAWGGDVAAGLDGSIWQWQDLGHTADANLDGNAEVISIETADNAPRLARDIEPWTARQLESIIGLVAWLCTPAAHAGCPGDWECHRSGIPAALVPDTRPGRRGIAYHRQGVNPWRVDGGVSWSGSPGKACPGVARIGQIAQIITGVQAVLHGDIIPLPAPTPAPSRPAPKPAGARPSPLPGFPLPSGYYFGRDDGTRYSVSGEHRRRFGGVLDRDWIKAFVNQLIERGWPCGKDKRYLTRFGNDGVIGDEYVELFRAFQRDQRLADDGKVGVRTWAAASTNPIT